MVKRPWIFYSRPYGEPSELNSRPPPLVVLKRSLSALNDGPKVGNRAHTTHTQK